MDEAWKQLPCAAVIVCASVLGSSNARAEQPEANTEADASARPESYEPIAPTCGPSCHGGGEIYREGPGVLPKEEIEVAPTCGPSCHGGGDEQYPDVGPPPVEPDGKQGCAVEDAGNRSPIGLALLSVGLLAGVAARRRRDHEVGS